MTRDVSPRREPTSVVPTRAPVVRDAWSAAALVALAGLRVPLNLAATGGVVLWPSLVLGTVELGSLVWRRVVPEVALTVATLTTVAALAGPRYPLTGLGVVLAAYAVGAHRPPVRAAAIAAGASAVHAVGGSLAGARGAGSGLVLTFLDVPLDDVRGVVLASVASVGVPALVGAFVRTRRELVRELRERVSRAERDRDAAARRAVADERSRIARELHDVAAHDLSAIVVQAGAADRLVGRDEAAARRALAAIRGQGRETLSAMRAIVGILREDDGEGRAPQPTLDDLDRLVASARTAGGSVVLDRSERRSGGYDAAVELAAYRVVQEALANARRHAPEQDVEVTVTDDGSDLRVRVANLLAPGERPRPDPDGHGLLGMRERVQQVRGRLRAGPQDGRWVVDAWLPSRRPPDTRVVDPAEATRGRDGGGSE